MAITLLTSVNVQFATSTTNTVAIDTTGASLIVIGLTYRQTQGAHISDSAGNTWTSTGQYEGSGNQSGVIWYYKYNPSTSATHTFNNTDGGGTSNFGGISVFVFSGTRTASTPFDQVTGKFNSSPVTPDNPGTITPSVGGCVMLTGVMNYNGSAPTMPTGYTGFTWTTATAFAGGHGYKIKTTASSETPSWGNLNTGATTALNVIDFMPPAATATLKSLSLTGVGT